MAVDIADAFREAGADFDAAFDAKDAADQAECAAAVSAMAAEVDRAMGHGFEPFEIPCGRHIGPVRFVDDGPDKWLTVTTRDCETGDDIETCALLCEP